MKKWIKTGVFNADDEVPNCLRCDHVVDASEHYCEECTKNFWAHYKRTEYIVIGSEGK